MNKERLTAFTDAILAIVMTILVLELEKPESSAQLSAIWALRSNFIAYAVSFFWLGAMWVNLHSQWQKVSKIDNKVVWLSIVMLFFASLLPYVTSLVSKNFDNRTMQGLYWTVAILVSLSNLVLGQAVGEANKDDTKFYASVKTTTQLLWLSIGIKVLIFALAMVVYPPIAIYSILLVGLIFSVVLHRYRREKSKV